MNLIFFFFGQKKEVFWPITQISQQGILFWKCHQVFLQKSVFSEESHHFPPPKQGKTASTASSCAELTSAPLADQNPTWCMETNGAFKPREHLVYNIFSSFMFVLLEACALGSISVCACACMSVLIYSKYKLFSERT